MISGEVFSKQLIMVSILIFCYVLAFSYPHLPFQSARLFFASKFQKPRPWEIQTWGRKINRFGGEKQEEKSV